MYDKSDRRDGNPGGARYSKSGDGREDGVSGTKGQGLRIDQLLASSGRLYRGKPEPHVMHAGRVRNELARLASDRLARNGECLPDGATAFLLARIAVIRVGQRWTIDDIRDVARHANIPMPDEGAAVREARKAARELRLGAVWLLPSADVLGDMLNVTAEEHRECRMHAIGIAFQTVEERRRRKDRDRKQDERAARGATPRAQSLSATKPWNAEGVSRRTWERRRHASDNPASDANPSAHNRKKDKSVDEFATQHASRAETSLPLDPAVFAAVVIELDELAAARRRARAQPAVRIMTGPETKAHLLGRAAEAFARIAMERRQGSGSIAA